jgi:hypothetical protein
MTRMVNKKVFFNKLLVSRQEGRRLCHSDSSQDIRQALRGMARERAIPRAIFALALSAFRVMQSLSDIDHSDPGRATNSVQRLIQGAL